MSGPLGWFWKAIYDNRLDEAELARRFEELKARLPQPVIWLLGKAQAGKTSIIHGLTGDPRAEIGNGFEPCTRFSRQYAFPSKESPLIHFLDTRGLEDVTYDPNEDLKWHEEKSHLLMVVVRAMDQGLEHLRRVVSEIRRRRPEWPIVVVQTCLHEGYPWQEPRHPLPYPFDQVPFPPQVPEDLARSLQRQRALFADLQARFVAIDFTLPEDGFEPALYGLEQLWKAIDEAFPVSLHGIIKQSVELRRILGEAYSRPVQQTILAHSMLAGAAAAVPIPAVDLPFIIGIQTMMTRQIARIYGQALTQERLVDLLGTLGWGFATSWGMRYISRELLKAIPWVGMTAAAVFTAASTYALGKVLAWYFAEIKAGHVPDQKTLRKMYEKDLEAARRVWQKSPS